MIEDRDHESSLDPLDEPADEDVEDAWAAEIRRRIEEIESGEVRPIPWDQARRTMFGSKK
jgi:putative addiction module component (TIGR02574 family)